MYSQEELDTISVIASRLVADDFANHDHNGEPPSITPGMVLWTIKAIESMGAQLVEVVVHGRKD